MDIHRSYYYYESNRDDSEVETAIRESAVHGEGFWKVYAIIRRKHEWNHKKVYRVYKALHFEKRSRLRKRLPARTKLPLETPSEENDTWSIDFVSDAIECGRKFRVLNILDDFNRKAVAQKLSMSMPARRVIRFLEEAIWINGKPKNLRCDNGPEFISHEFQSWCKGNDICIKYTQPGCPTQNSYIERFNGTYRRAVLDAYIFRNLEEAKSITEKWMNYYNTERPHVSLGNMTPQEYTAMQS